MSRNVRLYLLAEFLRGTSFAYAIATLFYQELGLNFTQLSMLWLAMSVAQLICEVPCGLLSDKLGHRLTVIAGFAVFVCTMLVIGVGNNFWMMLAGGFLWGVSAALLSGANDALLYETLKHEGRESAYLRLLGSRGMLMSLGIIIGAIPGAYAYTFYFRLPWYLNACAIGLGLICLLFVQSPPRASADDQEHISGWKHLRQSAAMLFGNKPLLWLSLFLTLSVFPLYGFALIRQPYLISRGLEVAHLGYIFAGIEILSSFVSWQAHRIDKALGFSVLLCATLVLITLCYALLSTWESAWALAPLATLYAGFRLMGIVVNAYTNKRISSEQRATILSLQSMGSSVLLIAFMLSSGYILDHFDMNPYLMALSLYIAVVLMPLYLLRCRFGITAQESVHA